MAELPKDEPEISSAFLFAHINFSTLHLFWILGENKKPRKIMFNIILVDDHRNFGRALKLVLHDQFSSLNVIEAGNGEEAIKKADSQPVDLIFMDIHLPGKGGLETTLR